MGSALRVGLVLDGLVQPRWVHGLIERIQATSVAQIELLVLAPPPPRASDRLARHLLYRAYTWADDRLFQSADDSLQPASVEQLVASVPRLRVGPGQAELAQVARSRLDVLLDLAGHVRAEASSGVARFGIWTLHHGRDLSTAGGPPGFWEVFEQDAATGSLLVVTDGTPPVPRVVYRSYAPTDQRSVRRSTSNYYPKTADFIVRKLIQLHDEGPAAIGETVASDGPPPPRRYARPPDNREMLGLLRRLALRYLGEKGARLSSVDQWFVAYSAEAQHATARPGLRAFTYLLPPRDRYWADPFPVYHAGHTYIFLEEFLLDRGRAHISVSRVDSDGRCEVPVPVLERPYHLSYPFVFEWQGSHYMLPESCKNRAVELYRASRFPFEWQLDRVLVEGLSAADATLAHIDDRWWLFANIGVPGSDNSDELHLFHATSPLGPWRPHRRNPVKSDARSARPAGRIVQWQGAYLRPAQDCAGRYGRAVILNRIMTLDPDEYLEQEVGRIEPAYTGGVFATHTLNMSGSFVCLDGVIRAPRKTIRNGPRLSGGVAILDSNCNGTATSPSSAGFRATGLAAALLDGVGPRAC
jgi:hypothetical protein